MPTTQPAQGTRWDILEPRVLLARMGLDYSFGTAGLAQINAGVFVAPLSDGEAVAVSPSEAVRISADGTIDGAFFDQGFLQAGLARLDWIASSAVVSGSRLYIAGVPRSRQANETFDSDTVFVRALNLADGSLVDSFGDHGFMEVVITSLTPGDTVYHADLPSIAATADGGFVFTVAQRSRSAAGDEHSAVTLYKSDARGRLSHTSGGNGEVVVPSQHDEDLAFATANGLALDAAGRIYAQSHRLITRYLASGSLDQSYGEGGTANAPSHDFFPDYGRFTVQPDGKAIIPISADSDGGPYSLISRLNVDGTGDAEFGSSGFTFSNGASSPVVDDQGRILFFIEDTIARLNPAFQLDTTFADNGHVPIPSGFGNGMLALADDGTSLVGSTVGVSRYAVTDPVQLDSSGELHVEGYGGDDDDVKAVLDGRFLNVTFNGEIFTYRTSKVRSISVFTREGNDSVDLAVDLPAAVSTSFGDDTIRITGSAPVHVMCGEGIDFIQTGDGNDTILAGGRDTILSGGGDDQISSQPPERYYLNYPDQGTASYLEVDMGAGDDVIHPGRATSIIWGGEGNDLIDSQDNFSEEQVNRINGEGGDDTIRTGAGADIITSGPGDDVIDAGPGMNRADGVTVFGSDFQNAFAGFTLDDDGTLTYTGSAAEDLVQIETSFAGLLLIWREYHATAADPDVIKRIHIIGGDGNDYIGVNITPNIPATVDGGNGNDEISGGAAADLLIGGAGNDSISANEGNDTIIAGNGDDSLYGGGGNDSLRGESGNDYFEGGAGDDTLLGGAGADRLFGLAGNDTLLSDEGVQDTVRGGTGIDTGDVDDLDDVLTVESLI